MNSLHINTISVVIPTCDRLDFLKETVQCVIEQSRPADEIIVVNNGKAPLPQAYLPENIKVLELAPYVGVSRARNEGVAVASGDYIAFQDDDDLWEKDYLKKVASLIKQENPDCIITRKDKLYDNKIMPYKNASGKLNLPVLFTINPGIGGPTTIVKREIFNTLGGYDTSLPTSEDKALIIDLIIKGYGVKAASNIQAIIRVHGGSRLTNSEFMDKGIKAFVKKYSNHMTFAQRNFNWLKVYYHRYRSNKGFVSLIKFKIRCYVNNVLRTFDTSLPASLKL